jgi:hypothetical protein
VNIATLFRAVDAIVAVRDAAKRFRRSDTDPLEQPAAPPHALQGLAGQIETRLTNVVVAALKEAFDRDHARLELERAQLEEERRRAENLMKLERQRQAADRELARLRLLAGASMTGWIASVVLVAAGVAGGSMAATVTLSLGWALLLGALGASFVAQGRIGTVSDATTTAGAPGGAAALSLWLLIAGLAATAIGLLLSACTRC